MLGGPHVRPLDLLPRYPIPHNGSRDGTRPSASLAHQFADVVQRPGECQPRLGLQGRMCLEPQFGGDQLNFWSLLPHTADTLRAAATGRSPLPWNVERLGAFGTGRGMPVRMGLGRVSTTGKVCWHHRRRKQSARKEQCCLDPRWIGPGSSGENQLENMELMCFSTARSMRKQRCGDGRVVLACATPRGTGFSRGVRASAVTR